MPSLFEVFGLVALEAMQMGRPVIVSHVGGLPEIVSPGERGLLIPLREFPRENDSPLERVKWDNSFREKQQTRNQTDSTPILCDAMETLLTNQQETIQMGARSREWALKTYLLEENVNQYEELFKQCL